MNAYSRINAVKNSNASFDVMQTFISKEANMYLRRQDFDTSDQKIILKAILFATFMLVLFIVSATMAFVSTGPIVLGSEMNTNGFVEYLCLGRDCDNIF